MTDRKLNVEVRSIANGFVVNGARNRYGAKRDYPERFFATVPAVIDAIEAMAAETFRVHQRRQKTAVKPGCPFEDNEDATEGSCLICGLTSEFGGSCGKNLGRFPFPASVDTRRMAETGTGSGRSPSGAVDGGKADSETPKEDLRPWSCCGAVGRKHADWCHHHNTWHEG